MVAAKPRIKPLIQKTYVGIDVSKFSHMAAFISEQLLRKSGGKYIACPTLPFDNNRLGFTELLTEIKRHGPLEHTVALLEQTGHYHLALQQFLQEHGIQVYIIHVQKRVGGRDKTDKKDAQGLALLAYNQLELNVQVADTLQQIRPASPSSMLAKLLQPLVRHRFEMGRRETQIKNKLIALVDMLFPEFCSGIKDPNGPTALAIRRHFPTAAAIAAASPMEIRAICPGKRKFNIKKITTLHEHALQSVGLTDEARVKGLIFEQNQLIEELILLNKQIDDLDVMIEKMIKESREGQILMSIPEMDVTCASRIIAGIGSIANFETSSKLKAYFGWTPVFEQTGKSRNSAALSKGGNHLIKQSLYLATLRAVQADTEWKVLYDRLVPRKCQYDARTKKYKGKNKVIGRVIGQVTMLIWRLLWRDYKRLSKLAPGEVPPPPILYSRAVHRMDRVRRVPRKK